jgi:16S rRNA (cytosine967-C5)-methyltransferase
MLDAILRRGQTMDNAAQHARNLPPADAALASAIVGETLRRLPDLDALIDSATRLPLADDAKARMVLRLALAQKIGLGTPDHALVATALPLVDGGPRKLVHGVLGTLLRAGIAPIDLPLLPSPVFERWSRAWGPQVVAAARRAIVSRPALDLSFARETDYPLGTALAPLNRRLDDSSAVAKLPGFDDGNWWVQDLAASLPARMVPATARRVLDACAAPGGKTMQLAAAGHDVTALDRSESRLSRLAENLARTGLKAETVVGDVREWTPDEPMTRCCSTRPARRPARSAAIPKSSTARGPRSSSRWPHSRPNCCSTPPTGSGRAEAWSMRSARSSPRKASARSTPSLPSAPITASSPQSRSSTA